LLSRGVRRETGSAGGKSEMDEPHPGERQTCSLLFFLLLFLFFLFFFFLTRISLEPISNAASNREPLPADRI
jgi:hypothetical protein